MAKFMFRSRGHVQIQVQNEPNFWIINLDQSFN